MELVDLKILMTHAYSATNVGDGLLVDSTYEILMTAFPGAVITIAALDVNSFKKYSKVFHPLATNRETPNLIDLMRALFLKKPSQHFMKQVLEADLIVGVGGGYLRAKTVVEALKTRAAHSSQLNSLSSSSSPKIYFPQSVGPDNFRSLSGISLLSNVDMVCSRDDLTKDFLNSLGVATERFPDLVAFELITQAHSQKPNIGDDVVLIGREFPGSKSTYKKLFKALAKQEGFITAVQASGRGNDDRNFYNSIKLTPPFLPIDEVFDRLPGPAVTISVRLHGALNSLLHGVPAIQLGYERKSWGVFADLGLSDYVLGANTSDLVKVLDLANSLKESPSIYWEKLQSSVLEIERKKRNLIQLVKHAAEKNEGSEDSND